MGMDVYGAKPDSYFRASVWSWRPLMLLIERANKDLNIIKNIESWHYNDGAGLTTQEDCNKLADWLENNVSPNSKTRMESSMQVDSTGRFLPEGEKGESPYSISGEHVKKFIEFLRNCGGSFEIC